MPHLRFVHSKDSATFMNHFLPVFEVDGRINIDWSPYWSRTEFSKFAHKAHYITNGGTYMINDAALKSRLFKTP